VPSRTAQSPSMPVSVEYLSQGIVWPVQRRHPATEKPRTPRLSRHVVFEVLKCVRPHANVEQSLRVLLDTSLGVGFQNFNNYVTGEPRYVASYAGVSSLDWPHNTLAEILTETGIVGFVPYVMAHVLS